MSESRFRQFKAEYSKSSRSKCQKCQIGLNMHELRLVAISEGKYLGDRNYHLGCFFDCFHPESESAFDGFAGLRNEDKAKLQEHIKKGRSLKRGYDDGSSSSTTCNHSEPATKKLKTEYDQELDMRIHNQNEEFFLLRDNIQNTDNSGKWQERFLEYNDQHVPGGKIDLLDHVTDVSYFGAILPCNECRNGRFLFDRNSTYRCTGNISGFANCKNAIAEPERKPVKIPNELKEAYPFLKVVQPVRHRAVKTLETFPTTEMDEPYPTKTNDSNVWNIFRGGIPKILKVGTIVDSMTHIAHVYHDKVRPFTALLTRTDLSDGTNAFYKLQLLESDIDDPREYWIYRSWGQIGESIDDEKIDKYSGDLQSAVRFFQKKYKEKTCNHFTANEFVKYPNKYNLFVLPNEDAKNIFRLTESKYLKKPVQELLKLLIDERIINNVLVKFDLDPKKTPLAIISKEKILQAYAILYEIEAKLRGDASLDILTEASNRFYSFIPCSVTAKDIIDCVDKIKERAELLKNIEGMKFTFNFLHKKTLNKAANFLDAVHAFLNAQIEPLNHGSDEFEAIEKYVQDTKMDSNFDIEEIFKVYRKDDEARFEPFKHLANRTLLWHGSPLTNYPSILHKGLKIMERPVNGAMFGKAGLYFADVLAKAARFCEAEKTDNTGIVSLCEVALGNSHICHDSENIEHLPPGKQSVFAVGKWTTAMNINNIDYLDGVAIPTGKPVKMNDDSILNFNEFVIYKDGQAKIKYLVQLKFN